jgi:hypothetical protein
LNKIKKEYLPYLYLSLSGIVFNTFLIVARNITTKPKISLFSQVNIVTFILTTISLTVLTCLFIKALSNLLFSKNGLVYFLTSNILTIIQSVAALLILLIISNDFSLAQSFTDFPKPLFILFIQTAPFNLCLFVSTLVISAIFRPKEVL